jgi:hypothetical protein
MIIENEFIKAEAISHTYAQPSINSIGYGGYSPAICIPRTLFISAHAPSLLKVKFKNSGKYYINGNHNRTTGIRNNSITYNVRQESLNVLNFKASLQYHPFYAIEGHEYFFEIECADNYGAHTIWSIWKSQEEVSDFEDESLIRSESKSLEQSSDYSLFVQTCNPKKKMAFRCIVSFLNNIGRLPNKIVVCSLDDINDEGIRFPSCVDFWTGRPMLTDKLTQANLSIEAIDHIFDGFKTAGNPNMWLKYAIPRLCMKKEKILIVDDDVAFLGRCDELIDSNSYLTFMEDSHSFYGPNTIRWYRNFYGDRKYEARPPYVCAGMCKVDCSKMEYNHEFIDGMIRTSESDPDEQCAVGMEIVTNPDYTTLLPPKYHHGGFSNQNVDLNSLELMHMQGRAVGWRDNKEFIKLYMSK